MKNLLFNLSFIFTFSLFSQEIKQDTTSVQNLEEVIVSSIRVKQNAPIAFTNVSKDEFHKGVAPRIEYSYKHRLGRCVLHLGKQVHSVSSVSKGERHVLIMWCRSIRNQRAIQCPCCREFNRKMCVCVPELFGGAY